MLANKTFTYEIDGKSYQVYVHHKRVRNINYRVKDGAFHISCPRWTMLSTLKSGLDKYARRLLKRTKHSVPIGEDYIYLLGEKVYLSFPGAYTFFDESFSYKNMDDFRRKVRKVFLKYLTIRTMYWAEKMNAPQYEVKIRETKSRLGTNRKSNKSITYGFMLIHYPLDIIDSVVIHELTHCFVYNHSDKFYRLLYVYCPNYDILRKRLIKTEFN